MSIFFFNSYRPSPIKRTRKPTARHKINYNQETRKRQITIQYTKTNKKTEKLQGKSLAESLYFKGISPDRK